MNMKGIDVSKHQGIIDWDTVKPQIGFAIVRAGYGMYASQVDNQWERNYSECKRLCIPAGAYWYSYAKTEAEAVKEAELFISVLSGKQLEFPVYFDIEDRSQAGLGKGLITAMCYAFCRRMEQAGYFTGIYSNTDWFLNRIDNSVGQEFTIWLADYRTAYNTTLPRDIHQYTSSGQIKGIAGRVDLNTCTRDFSSIIKSGGFNGFAAPADDSDIDDMPTPTQSCGTVNCDRLNVRIAPYEDSIRLRQVARGNQVLVTGVYTNGWLQVDIEGVVCCVAGQYINYDATGIPSLDPSGYIPITGTVTGNLVNVRNGPGTGNKVLFQVARDNSLNVYRERGGWYKINCLHGDGWINQRFVDLIQ